MRWFPVAISMWAAVCLLADTAAVAGRWMGVSNSGVELRLNLDAPKGSTITGTASFNGGRENAISNGKVDGETVSFQMPSLYGGSTVDVEGKLLGQDLRIKLSSERGEGRMLLRRPADPAQK